MPENLPSDDCPDNQARRALVSEWVKAAVYSLRDPRLLNDLNTEFDEVLIEFYNNEMTADQRQRVDAMFAKTRQREIAKLYFWSRVQTRRCGYPGINRPVTSLTKDLPERIARPGRQVGHEQRLDARSRPPALYFAATQSPHQAWLSRGGLQSSNRRNPTAAKRLESGILISRAKLATIFARAMPILAELRENDTESDFRRVFAPALT